MKEPQTKIRRMGRPPMPNHMVRKLIAVTLPDWMVTYLKDQENISHYVEAAVSAKIARDADK